MPERVPRSRLRVEFYIPEWPSIMPEPVPGTYKLWETIAVPDKDDYGRDLTWGSQAFMVWVRTRYEQRQNLRESQVPNPKSRINRIIVVRETTTVEELQTLEPGDV